MRLALLLVARTPGRLLALAAILTLVGTIALLFAWMTPSMQAAELAVWRRLPADVMVGDSPAGGGSCLLLYSAAAARAEGQSAYGHPDLVVGDRATLAMLGLALPVGTHAVADPIAATAAQVSSGGVAEISSGPLQFSISVAVGSMPTQLTRAGDGAIGVVRQALPGDLPPPDRHVCLGASEGQTAASIAGSIAERQRTDGLTSATTVFAALAFGAWITVLTMATLGVLRRRRSARTLLAGLGLSAIRSALVSSLEVPGAALVALLVCVTGTVWLRSVALRTWTDPDLIAVSVLASVVTVLGTWAGWCSLRRQQA